MQADRLDCASQFHKKMYWWYNKQTKHTQQNYSHRHTYNTLVWKNFNTPHSHSAINFIKKKSTQRSVCSVSIFCAIAVKHIIFCQAFFSIMHILTSTSFSISCGFGLSARVSDIFFNYITRQNYLNRHKISTCTSTTTFYASSHTLFIRVRALSKNGGSFVRVGIT